MAKLSNPFCQRNGVVSLLVLLAIQMPNRIDAQRPEDKPLPPTPPVEAAYRFHFALDAPDAGYRRVEAGTDYEIERGYGFDLGSDVQQTPVGVTTEDSPFFFSVEAPEGNYRITATFVGASEGGSAVTIRTEVGRLMATAIRLEPGEVVTRTFVANVRRPQLPPPPANAPGDSIVNMFLAGEAESRVWDEKLTIEFNGKRPVLRALEIVKDDRIPTVFVAGDSTVGDPRRGPGGNWPTQICQFFRPALAVCNSAEGGETSKSFITGARFDKVLSQMKAGDFFLVQFGHNDSKPQWPQTYTEPQTTFKAYLGVYLAETRRRGATLVLVTPMERRANEDSVGPWARAMREFAAENDVPLIDQWSMSKELWTALGSEVGTAFSDQTHLSGYGGYLLSKVVATGIQQGVPALAEYLTEDFEPINLSEPPPPPAYLEESSGAAPNRR